MDPDPHSFQHLNPNIEFINIGATKDKSRRKYIV
jgi:hypothetical protein